jgi:hypothetical protein
MSKSLLWQGVSRFWECELCVSYFVLQGDNRRNHGTNSHHRRKGNEVTQQGPPLMPLLVHPLQPQPTGTLTHSQDTTPPEPPAEEPTGHTVWSDAPFEESDPDEWGRSAGGRDIHKTIGC